MSNIASALTGTAGERATLQDVSVSAVLRDLLAEVTVTQTYRNDESVNIAAVCTFPLPLDAVLLDLRVEIGGRILKGMVVGKADVEEKGDNAVVGGDAAVMLEVSGQGFYRMNVGNLLPRETATIAFTFGLLYRWTGDSLRIHLPTTIAPRYGESRSLPHQSPESSAPVEHPFSLQVEVRGSMRDAQFICPTHPVELTKSAEKLLISLRQKSSVMDHDFVLNIKAPGATRSFALCGSDLGGVAAVASFQPFFPGLHQPRSLNLAILVDCSGSMQGESIEQVRQALDRILDALHADDRVTLIAFGNTISRLSDRLLPCNKANLVKAKQFARLLNADMGGTEVGGALQDAYGAVSGVESADILLLTDGEVVRWEAVVEDAKLAGHRIFTVGVGSAVSEAFVRGLAESTGGACELVSPREGMATRVIRHFERMRSVRASRVVIHWPTGDNEPAPAGWPAIFEGDTIVASARFNQAAIDGTVVLEIETDVGEVVRHELPLSSTPPREPAAGLSTVARLAAAARLKELADDAACGIAVRYQLTSPWTNWIVVAERPEGERAQDTPALGKVPRTIAAGWGGAGAVNAFRAMASSASMSGSSFSAQASGRVSPMAPDSLMAGDRVLPAARGRSPSRQSILALIDADPSRLHPHQALQLLQDAGVAREFDGLFGQATELRLSVDAIAAIVVAMLLGGPLGARLPTEAQQAALELQSYAEKAIGNLRDANLHGQALVRIAEDAIGGEMFGYPRNGGFMAVLAQCAECRGLLDRLESQAKVVADRLLGECAAAE